ncbi:hypothetical protein [Flagellimonas myxillae]|uniref:hypothetical protein n=1 Tax=Flagellimonas myxillae TaxID=2942214 RepID=UPI00201F58A4|nr:hypothetical protein [Muricauda myxillae]MCL6268252.1 hypothetical protein [Muricauda myxillae]
MKMLQQLHLAAQYLATAGISFLDKKEDDSHTNLGFSVASKRLETWPLNEAGTQLCLNYLEFSLEWSGTEERLSLEGKDHETIVDWVSKTASKVGLSKPYQFNLHYKLPYSLGGNATFGSPDSDSIQQLIQIRTVAKQALSNFLEMENLSSDIRVWPHHFDTGAFAALNDGSGKSIGLGLAIPDSLVDDLYFYISGYRGPNNLNTWAFKSLTQGKWVNNNFKGAILPASGITKEVATQFFKEAMERYKN